MTYEEKKVTFKCPNPECGTVFRKPIGWFKYTHHVHCFNCGQEFAVDTEKIPELKARLQQINKT